MSEDTSKNTIDDEALPLITLKELNSFISERAPEKPCPECDTKDWLAEGETNEGENSVVLPIHLSSVIEGKGLQAFTLTCSNCGFVKFYDATIITDWVASK